MIPKRLAIKTQKRISAVALLFIENLGKACEPVLIQSVKNANRMWLMWAECMVLVLRGEGTEIPPNKRVKYREWRCVGVLTQV